MVVLDPSAAMVLEAAVPLSFTASPPLMVIVLDTAENPPDEAVTVNVPDSTDAVMVVVAFPSAPVVALDGLLDGA